MKKKNVLLASFALSAILGGKAFAAADIIQGQLTDNPDNPTIEGAAQHAETGAQLAFPCRVTLTGLDGRAASEAGADLRTKLLPFGGQSESGKKDLVYSKNDGFAVDASCAVTLTIACKPGYEAGEAERDPALGACVMVRDAVSAQRARASDVIEIVDINFRNGETPSGNYLDLDLDTDGAGVVNESALSLDIAATLGASHHNNKAGKYIMDFDVVVTAQAGQ